MSVQLSKTPKINLTKGQVINLTKDGTSLTEQLHNIYFEASWGKIKGRSVDLDTSLICYDENYNKKEVIYYGNKISKNNSIKHSGDDLVGGKTTDVDNETITINLDRIDNSISYIVATLNSYSGQSFNKLPYMYSRIYTGILGNPDEILCKYDVKDIKSSYKTAIVLGFFYKKDNFWKFKTSGLFSGDTRITNMINGIAKQAIRNTKIDHAVKEKSSIINKVINFIKKIF